MFSLSVTNSQCAYNYFACENMGIKPLTKSEFIRKLSEEMVTNDEYKRDVVDSLRDKKRTSFHELVKLEIGKGKWNGIKFPDTQQKYQKYRCSLGCKREVRTYCMCDKSMYCQICFAIHFSEYNV